MHLKVLAAGATLALLQGCGDNGAYSSSEPAGEAPLPPAESEETADQPAEDLPQTHFERMMAGETLTIVLDACDPEDGENWDEEADPAGALVCGTEYKVSYDEENNLILTRGLFEDSEEGGEHEERYNGREWTGQVNRFNIWGARHYMNDAGEIQNGDKEVIGHILD